MGDETTRGCLPTLFVLVGAVVLILGIISAYRWTSIENGCLVERRLEQPWRWSGEGLENTVVVERLCPAARSTEGDDRAE